MLGNCKVAGDGHQWNADAWAHISNSGCRCFNARFTPKYRRSLPPLVWTWYEWLIPVALYTMKGAIYIQVIVIISIIAAFASLNGFQKTMLLDGGTVLHDTTTPHLPPLWWSAFNTTSTVFISHKHFCYVSTSFLLSWEEVLCSFFKGILLIFSSKCSCKTGTLMEPPQLRVSTCLLRLL